MPRLLSLFQPNGVPRWFLFSRKCKLFTFVSETAIKYASLIVLVIQNAAQVLVMRYVRTRPLEMFLSTVAVFLTEVVKLIACFLWITIQERSLIKSVRLC